jgi:hypothetical protein
MMTDEPMSDEQLTEIEAQMQREEGPVVSLYRVDAAALMAEVRRLREMLAVNKAEPPSDERLAEIEAEHADPDHYEESTSCSALELIAEIRRLRGIELRRWNSGPLVRCATSMPDISKSRGACPGRS